MHEPIYTKLKQVARNKSTVFYSDIAPLADLDMEDPRDREQMSEILGEISEFEMQRDAPMLSAVVVLKGSGMPGEGFFSLARRWYEFDDELRFFSEELQRVHDHWTSR